MLTRRQAIKLDPRSRRAFLRLAAQSALGLSLFGPRLAARATATESAAPARNLIYVYLSGGMSHLDTFDPKPGSEVQGPTGVLDTNIEGVQLSEQEQ